MTEPTTDQNDMVNGFMNNNPCAVIATISEDGSLNMANVFVYTDDDFTLYFVSRPEHRKHLNVEARHTISLLFRSRDTVEQVEYQGTATIESEADSIADTLSNLQKILIEQRHHYWIPPISQLNEGSGYVTIKVVPQAVTYRSYNQSGTDVDLKEVNVDLG